MTEPPLLTLEGITKSFPNGVTANAEVDFALRAGEIHALLGENGAGKSTLMKILYGLLQPDAGVIRIDGAPRRLTRPGDAQQAGIGMVFQHFSLFEALTVAENVALGLPGAQPGQALAAEIQRLAERYRLALDPYASVYSLSVGEKQRIEIVRVLLQNPRLLVLDEPTSVLTPQETDRLFDTLQTLASQGTGIVFISHKLKEVRALCHRATVLRAGRVVATCDPRTESTASLAERMVGERPPIPPAPPRRQGPVILDIEDLDLAPEDTLGVHLEGLGLSIRQGEIVGIAGVAGNGQRELLDALSGERPVARQSMIRIDGVPCGRERPGRRRRLGARFVPEERLGRGAVPDMVLAENLYLTRHQDRITAVRGWIPRGRLRRETDGVVSAFDVRNAGPRQPIGSLSGGNIQKFVVGREVQRTPALLVVAQPTWGVDTAAAATIHDALRRLAAHGTGVLVIAQDLDELFALSDRIAVLASGRLTAAEDPGQWTRERIGLAMAGADPGAAPDATEVQSDPASAVA